MNTNIEPQSEDMQARLYSDLKQVLRATRQGEGLSLEDVALAILTEFDAYEARAIIHELMDNLPDPK